MVNPFCKNKSYSIGYGGQKERQAASFKKAKPEPDNREIGEGIDCKLSGGSLFHRKEITIKQSAVHIRRLARR